MYYLSQPDDKPLIRLYVPSHFKILFLQYNDGNGHIGVEKTFHIIKQKYFWPDLLKEINEFVGKCQSCNLRKQ